MVVSLELLACLVVFLPLLSAVIIGFGVRCISDKVSQIISCSLVSIAAILSFYLSQQLITSDVNAVHITLLSWFDIGTFKANWTIYVDVLTGVMLRVVTVVSALVHIYSVGYMSHDKHKPRFMAYLSLFTFFMLMLVVSDNFIQLFLGWEGVGLSSYLLIGFWFQKDSAKNAAMKAFLVNRVGDIGLALGIALIFMVFGSVEYAKVFSEAGALSDKNIVIFNTEFHAITAVCILLFIGAMGKSAQIGLHTWLPDAMEGPTPVSALIHAATMVTAGVFLVARCSYLFEYSALALNIVTLVGGVTCVFAASVALVQNDIKKIIAYSTCSQLGYMFFACGVSAYSAGMFHLVTHAFFKALLFLGAGSVIHAMSDEQDIRKMGGIWKKIPFTYAMMWIGSLALAGVYPFAGYFSKDIILESAYVSSSQFGEVAYWLGISGAVMTAFYSWRLIIMVFHGTPRSSSSVMNKVHESGFSMTLPLAVLSIGAICSGAVGYYIYNVIDPSLGFWKGSLFVLDVNNPLEKAHNVEPWVKASPLVAGGIGIFIAYIAYMSFPKLASWIYAKMQRIYNFLHNKWYFDEIYNVVFTSAAKCLGIILWKRSDTQVIDGGINGLASLINKFSKGVSIAQTGFIVNYILVMFIGVLLLLTWVVFGIY